LSVGANPQRLRVGWHEWTHALAWPYRKFSQVSPLRICAYAHAIYSLISECCVCEAEGIFRFITYGFFYSFICNLFFVSRKLVLLILSPVIKRSNALVSRMTSLPVKLFSLSHCPMFASQDGSGLVFLLRFPFRQ